MRFSEERERIVSEIGARRADLDEVDDRILALECERHSLKREIDRLDDEYWGLSTDEALGLSR